MRRIATAPAVLIRGTAWNNLYLLTTALVSQTALAEQPTEQGHPAPCRGFLETDHTNLIGVWGSYGLRHAAAVSAVALSLDVRLALSGTQEGT
ncbi:MAG: hypothetical protein ACYSUI_25080, partial [Planctomycetota bacterium]